MLTNMFIAAAILFTIFMLWAASLHYLAPRAARVDGKAKVTGRCGTLMEMEVAFQDGKVTGISRTTTGCAKSMNCLEAAADMAMNRTPEEIAAIDPDQIQDKAGGLPSDDMDCAVLAHDVLKAAVADYVAKK